MVDVFPKYYQRMFEMISGLYLKYQLRTVLELGCDVGHFVGFLREQGFLAEGIDGKLDTYRDDLRNFLHQGPITDIRKVFGDRQFDLIVGQGVVCFGSQFDYSYGKRSNLGYLVLLSVTDSQVKKQLEGNVKEKIEFILKSSFNQLTPGGLFVACENIAITDRIGFTQETAKKLGYEILVYGKQEAILQKPK